MQADPYLAPEALKSPQGWNRYAYVAGDPVNYYDPAGLFIEVRVPFPPLPAVYNVTTVAGENGWLEGVGGAVADFESGGEVSEGSAAAAAAYLHIRLSRIVGRERYLARDYSEGDLKEAIQAYNKSSIAPNYAEEIWECAQRLKAGDLWGALRAIRKIP